MSDQQVAEMPQVNQGALAQGMAKNDAQTLQALIDQVGWRLLSSSTPVAVKLNIVERLKALLEYLEMQGVRQQG